MIGNQYCELLTPSNNVFYKRLPKMNGYHLNFKTHRQPGKELVCLNLVPHSRTFSKSLPRRNIKSSPRKNIKSSSRKNIKSSPRRNIKSSSRRNIKSSRR
jgi:hypothetical protein